MDYFHLKHARSFNSTENHNRRNAGGGLCSRDTNQRTVNRPITSNLRTNLIQGSTKSTTKGEVGSFTAVEEDTMARSKPHGPMVDDIPGYVPLRKERAPVVWVRKSNKNSINMPTMPKGVHAMTNIVSQLQKLQYNDNDILAYWECTQEVFEERK